MSQGNKNKAKGTTFETSVKKGIIETGIYDADRAPMFGKGDQADVWATHKNRDLIYIIECKAYKKPSRALIEEWRKQAIKECNNYRQAHPDVKVCEPLLIVKAPGQSIKDAIVHYLPPLDSWAMEYFDEFFPKDPSPLA